MPKSPAGKPGKKRLTTEQRRALELLASKQLQSLEIDFAHCGQTISTRRTGRRSETDCIRA
jgi:hypothetical protein